MVYSKERIKGEKVFIESIYSHYKDLQFSLEKRVSEGVIFIRSMITNALDVLSKMLYQLEHNTQKEKIEENYRYIKFPDNGLLLSVLIHNLKQLTRGIMHKSLNTEYKYDIKNIQNLMNTLNTRMSDILSRKRQEIEGYSVEKEKVISSLLELKYDYLVRMYNLKRNMFLQLENKFNIYNVLEMALLCNNLHQDLKIENFDITDVKAYKVVSYTERFRMKEISMRKLLFKEDLLQNNYIVNCENTNKEYTVNNMVIQEIQNLLSHKYSLLSKKEPSNYIKYFEYIVSNSLVVTISKTLENLNNVSCILTLPANRVIGVVGYELNKILNDLKGA